MPLRLPHMGYRFVLHSDAAFAIRCCFELQLTLVQLLCLHITSHTHSRISWWSELSQHSSIVHQTRLTPQICPERPQFVEARLMLVEAEATARLLNTMAQVPGTSREEPDRNDSNIGTKTAAPPHAAAVSFYCVAPAAECPDVEAAIRRAVPAIRKYCF